MKNPPVCLFVYNRVSHTRNILKSLSECKNFCDYKIYIFSDNFKPKNNNDKTKVKLVRDEVIKFKKNHKNIFIKFSKINL